LAARRAVEILDAAGLDAAGLDAAGQDAAALDAVDVRVEAMALWAWAEAVAGDPPAADELLTQLDAVLGGRRPSDLQAHVIAHALAFAMVRQGRFADSYGPQIDAAAASERAQRPDLTYGAWANAACAAVCAGDVERGLEFVDRGLDCLRGSGLGPPQVHLLAGRAHILLRLGREGEARTAARQQREVAEAVDDPRLLATTQHDNGLLSLLMGGAGPAERLLASALQHDVPVSRPFARLARAEALVRLGRLGEAEEELRLAVLEPVRPADLPDLLVPRLSWLQGLIARGRGDDELADRRLRESANGWRRAAARSGEGDRFVSSVADFGRPPVMGLVEPQRELARVLADLDSLSRPGTAGERPRREEGAHA
jgi:hypothetical protein